MTPLFNNIANISTGSIPPFLFNLAGVITWNYFKECLTATSDTFKKNEAIFGKVYFPRIIMPLSIIVSNLIKFGIQLLILVAFYIYFVMIGYDLKPNGFVFLFPVLVLFMGMLGLGMIISSMVTKYPRFNLSSKFWCAIIDVRFFGSLTFVIISRKGI
ncbi:MAG: ABC transporter permease [Flavobacteriales bacterium]|nr:ABC transporter permease [Flavobacteriales bacterium]